MDKQQPAPEVSLIVFLCRRLQLGAAASIFDNLALPMPPQLPQD
jgi:hypothetical protein